MSKYNLEQKEHTCTKTLNLLKMNVKIIGF